jgi:hypothetical protein
VFKFFWQNIHGVKTFQMKKQERLQREEELLSPWRTSIPCAGTQTAATVAEYE